MRLTFFYTTDNLLASIHTLLPDYQIAYIPSSAESDIRSMMQYPLSDLWYILMSSSSPSDNR